jgi:hypothetical protein
MLNDDETNLLIDKIDQLFGVKPAMRKDRKRDGRSFNYLYFPRRLTLLVRPKFKQFLVDDNLSSMYYKFGGLDYVDPVEGLTDEALKSINLRALANAIAGAKRSGVIPELYETARNVHVKWTQSNGPRERIYSKEAV